MQSVEQYAGEKTAAFREDQGKYHPVDQGEADLKDRLPKVRAACQIQNMAEPEKDRGKHHRLSHAALQPQAADDARR